jgi:hypothetical protein
MARFIPSGQLTDGSRGLPIDKTSNLPTAAAIEILDTLPSVASTDNYPGRTVFLTTAANLYMFNDDPSDEWIAVKEGVVEVAAPAPSASDPEGTLYYSTDTDILYIRVGSLWVPIAGERGAGVIWRHYTGDGATDTFATGSNQQPPVEFVQVYIDGAVQQPGSNGVRDYYMIGNDVKMNSVPSNGTAISVRTLTYTNVSRNSQFFALRHVADGIETEFDAGGQQMNAGQVMVTLDGVVQVCDTGGGNGTYDYKIESADNTISNLTSSGTTATATTTAAHGKSVSDPITIAGVAQSEYNGTFTIASVPTSTSFTYTMASDPGVSPATTASGDVMRFGPVEVNDKVKFYNSSGVATAPSNGLIVYIQAVENLIASFN